MVSRSSDTVNQVEHAAAPFLDAGRVAALGWTDAVDALERALVDGFDPEDDPPRSRMGTPSGELLLMPSRLAGWAGAKLVTVCPGNPAQGDPLVQGVYVLFDGPTLRPVALLDGAALTVLRTAAVSALAARHLAPPQAERLVVFGNGVQARGHVAALRAVLPIQDVTIVGRTAERAAPLASEVGGRAAGPADADDRVAEADVIVCATNAGVPLFSGTAARPGSVTLAIGSHTTSTREVDSVLAARSTPVVESRRSALAEAGDVVVPIEEGHLTADALVPLATVVRGRSQLDPAVPRLFAGTGMSWQDLVVAAAIASPALL
jgi:ornithine cyclodeaminase